MLRRQFFNTGLFAPLATRLQATPKMEMDEVFLHPRIVERCLKRQGSMASKILELFPKGCVVNVENIQKIINTGVTPFDLTASFSLPITGRFIYKSFVNGDTVVYMEDGFIHREDGPSIINEKEIIYYHTGDYYREDGPACIYPNKSLIVWRKKEPNLHVNEEGIHSISRMTIISYYRGYDGEMYRDQYIREYTGNVELFEKQMPILEKWLATFQPIYKEEMNRCKISGC